MSKELVTINGSEFAVKEFNGQRVVTLKDVAEVHNTKADFIARNFQRNRKHFIEGVDFFHLKGKKAHDKLSLPSKNATNLNVFTESGYLMLVKSLTDDLAWAVQRELINNYFKPSIKRPARRKREMNLLKIKEVFNFLTEDYKYLIYYRVNKGLTQTETGILLDLHMRTIRRMEQRLRDIIGIEIPPVVNTKDIRKPILLEAIEKFMETEV